MPVGAGAHWRLLRNTADAVREHLTPSEDTNHHFLPLFQRQKQPSPHRGPCPAAPPCMNHTQGDRRHHRSAPACLVLGKLGQLGKTGDGYSLIHFITRRAAIAVISFANNSQLMQGWRPAPLLRKGYLSALRHLPSYQFNSSCRIQASTMTWTLTLILEMTDFRSLTEAGPALFAK